MLMVRHATASAHGICTPAAAIIMLWARGVQVLAESGLHKLMLLCRGTGDSQLLCLEHGHKVVQHISSKRNCDVWPAAGTITNTSWFALLQCSCVQGSSHWQHGQ
jgi:hypothetical protein